MLKHMPWPLPALLTWGLAWALFKALLGMELDALWVLGAPCALGVGMSLLGSTWWRRLFIGLGFPVSVSVVGGLELPAWGWLVPLGVLLLIYPLNAWRDAPLFPTPPDALNELPSVAPLEPGARLLDAGCGLGHGLQALRQAYPLSQWFGLESSGVLAVWCARRCPWAQVERGDIWAADWSSYDLVYVFQRPESMNRALAKASAEMKAGTYLVSLEFEATGYEPQAHIQPLEVEEQPSGQHKTLGQGKPVWVYRAPFQARAQAPQEHPPIMTPELRT
jgi:hypothetical protein